MYAHIHIHISNPSMYTGSVLTTLAWAAYQMVHPEENSFPRLEYELAWFCSGSPYC